MKKFVFLMVVGLFLVVGCGSKGNKVVCTGKFEENGMSIKAEVIATLKDNKVSNVSANMIFDDEKTAKAFCGIYELANQYAEDASEKIDIECKGKTIKIKDYAKMTGDESEVIGISKEEFINSITADESGFSCK